LVLLILIWKSLVSLESDISALIFRLEVDDDDPEDNTLYKVLDDDEVDSKLISNSKDKHPV
jgi:hypothetical protein